MPKKNIRAKGKVYLVGAGPGDPGLLTLKGAALLKQADVVVHDWLINPDLLLLAPRAQKFYVGKNVHKKQGSHYVEQDKTNALLVKLAKKYSLIIRLKGGDPFVFGRGGEEASYLKKHKINFEIVPGISAGIGAPAYAGIPVTDRRSASLVSFITAHEGQTGLGKAMNWKVLAQLEGTIVLFMGVKTLSQVVASLIKEGKASSTLVSVIEWATLPQQRVVQGTLKTICQQVQRKKIQSPAVVVIGEVNRFRKELAWFYPEKKKKAKPLKGKTVLVTRASSQVSSLKTALQKKGATVFEFPTIRIEPPLSWAPLDKALKQKDKFDWVIFTSTNGVESVMGRLRKKGLMPKSFFSKIKIAAIGEATERSLKTAGLKVDLKPETYTSEALIQTLKKEERLKGKHFLLPRTDIAPPFLKRALKEAGAQVTEVIAYRTLPSWNHESKKRLKSWFKQDKIDYITFTSSSTVKHFFEALKPSEKKQLKSRLVSIGPITSETLREHGFFPYKEAKQHTVPDLVEVIANDNGF